MEHEAHVFLAVVEFGQDISVVTKLAGFEPTEAWVVGQPTQEHPGLAHRHSRWTFKSSLPLTAAVEDHLDALLSALEAHAPGIRAVMKHFPAEIRCAVYYRTINPGIHLSQALIARAAALGLDIDLDLYFLGNDGESDDHAT